METSWQLLGGKPYLLGIKLCKDTGGQAKLSCYQEKPDVQKMCMNSSGIVLWNTVKMPLGLENRSGCQRRRRKTAIGRRNESRLREQGSYIKRGLAESRSCAEHVDNIAFHVLPLGNTSWAEDQGDQQSLQHGRDWWTILLWNNRSGDPEGRSLVKGTNRVLAV